MNDVEKYYDLVHCAMAFNTAMEGKNLVGKERADAFELYSAGWTARNIPDRRVLPGRSDFFMYEEEIAAQSYNDGWNACRAEMLK